MRTLVVAIAIVAIGSGCEKTSRSSAGSSGQAPPGLPPSEGGGRAGRGGAGAPANPHGGMATGGGADPHAGLDLGGAGGADPHAGLDLGGAGGADPHGGAMGGAMGGAQDPHGGMAGRGAQVAAQDPQARVIGAIEIAPALAAKVKPGDAIFLIVRPIDASGQVITEPRSVLASDRLDAGTFPAAFTLAAKAQTPGGEVAVIARIDRDQDVSTRGPGDLEGVVRIAPPKEGFKLVVDTEVK